MAQSLAAGSKRENAAQPLPLAAAAHMPETLTLLAQISHEAGVPLFLQRSTVSVGQPGDPYEREAEGTAQRVANIPAPTPRSVAGRKPPKARTDKQGRNPAQRASAGQPLPLTLRTHYESLLGHDFEQVRVFTDGPAATSARAIHARAYTQGSNIVFAKGEYAPDTARGQHLLAHEMTHVVQQTGESNAAQATNGVPAIQRTPDDTASEVSPPTPAAGQDLSSRADSPPISIAPSSSEPPAQASAQQEAARSDTSEAGASQQADGTDAQAAAGEAAATQADGGTARQGGAGGGGGEGSGAGAANQEENSELAAGGNAAPSETRAGELPTGDLVLIDVELAEHQRWAGALGRVGEASSLQRAEFIAEAAGGGFASGAASGLTMGLGMGLVTRAVPLVGPIIGGGMALHGLVTRDWAETGATIASFGQGNDTYEVLANTIASVSAVIDVVSQVLNVINGIVSVVRTAALVIAGGATVAAFFTFGATAGIAIAAGEVAATCFEIGEGINIITMVLDGVNSAILQPSVALFRALHTFTTQADPREVEAQGAPLATAAAASGAALGAWAGGRAANARSRPRSPAPDTPPQRPPHETPPPAAGDGPTVHFQEPPLPAAHGETAPAPATSRPTAEPASVSQPDVAAQPVHAETAPAVAEPLPSSATSQSGETTSPRPMEQLPLFSPEALSPPPQASGPAVPTGPQRHPITPDVEIRGEFRDSALRVRRPGDTTPAAAGDIAPHQDQGARGSNLISEHVIPGAQMRDASVDPAHGAPDWQRSTPGGSDGRDYNRATTIVEHAAVSARKTELDNAATRALQQQGGPRNMREEMLNSLQRHQQAVDDAIAAGEITPQQATDPTHRALAAQAEMWGGGASGGAQARADDAAAGRSANLPRRPDRLREAEAARVRRRLAGEHIEEIDWEGTFPGTTPNPPPGTQLTLPGMAGVAPRPRAPEQLSLSFPEAPNPRQMSLPFEAGSPSAPAPTPGTGMQIRTHGTPTGEVAGLTNAEIDTFLSGIGTGGASSDTFFELVGQNPRTGTGLTALPDPRINPNPNQITYSQNMYFTNVDVVRIAGAGDVPIGADRGPNGSVIPAGVGMRSVPPQTSVGGAAPAGNLEVRYHSANPTAPAGSYSAANPTVQVNTPSPRFGWAGQRAVPVTGSTGLYLLPDGRWVSMARSTPAADRAAAHWPVGAPGAGPPAPTEGGPPPPPPALPPTVPPASTPVPPASPPAASSPASSPAATQPSGALSAGTAGTTRPAAAQASPAHPHPSRARQVGELFVPQVFGSGDAGPTFAQRQATHRARFTEDNQPAAGVERVNPDYPPPPITPAQIGALQNEILELLAARAREEQEAQRQSQRADVCQANQAPIQQTVSDTTAGIAATQAHNAAIARREELNRAQQQRQQESQGLVAGYPSRATGLAALSVPLVAWEGFTNLASHLPGDAGDKMLQMNQEAQQMQAAFVQMGAEMAGVDSAGPVRSAELRSDNARLAATGTQAVSSEQELRTASRGAQQLRSTNEMAMSDARTASVAASQHAEQLSSAAAERELRASTLAEQLRIWARTHQAARTTAIQATAQRLQRAGRTVVGSSEQ
jgi:hypothetical protein